MQKVPSYYLYLGIADMLENLRCQFHLGLIYYDPDSH